ncbi:uncharacterized protein LOC119670450 [Teleopsis dalmanni]|uniref:uncharacterized protein LOC119670450 n=1 Tax=Teleopsis dalmanni TaxID=139649 RepID=UPI0018CFD38D|nr:uncharacterized protein LOC119670450 [Teleopsis dalmanni]
MILDLKYLLLLSSQNNQKKHFRKRISVAKKSFIIEYELKGKCLVLKNIQAVPKKSKYKYLIKNLVVAKHQLPKLMKEKETQTPITGKNMNSEIDLSLYKYKDKITQTPSSSTVNKPYRMGLLEKCWKAKPPKSDMKSKFGSKKKSSKTLDCIFRSADKTVELKTIETQTDDQDYENHLLVEKNQLKCYLGSMKDLIFNQNQLIHNSSTMLSKMSELAQLCITNQTEKAPKEHETISQLLLESVCRKSKTRMHKSLTRNTVQSKKISQTMFKLNTSKNLYR